MDALEDSLRVSFSTGKTGFMAGGVSWPGHPNKSKLKTSASVKKTFFKKPPGVSRIWGLIRL